MAAIASTYANTPPELSQVRWGYLSFFIFRLVRRFAGRISLDLSAKLVEFAAQRRKLRAHRVGHVDLIDIAT